jgi:hypothetical protein
MHTVLTNHNNDINDKALCSVKKQKYLNETML